MKLYVCYSAIKNFRHMPRPGGHPCANAHVALTEAGHKPEVVAVGGLGGVRFLNRTAGRQEVRELSGSTMVPLLVTDEGEVIKESQAIMAWAEANPA